MRQHEAKNENVRCEAHATEMIVYAFYVAEGIKTPFDLIVYCNIDKIVETLIKYIKQWLLKLVETPLF